MIGEDVQLQDEELESEVELADRLSSSPPLVLSHRLTPLRKAHRPPVARDAFPLKPVFNKRSAPEADSPPSSAGDDSTRSESTLTHSPAAHCEVYRCSHLRVWIFLVVCLSYLWAISPKNVFSCKVLQN